MEKHLYPDFFARFYDLIYHSLRDGVDNQFFMDKIKNCKGKILEIGVGTGRFFIEALNSDADIYGIDISPEMINVLTNKLKNSEKQRVSVQSMVDFSLPHKFDMIIAPFRVFMHIIDKKEQLAALNHVFEYLNKGGIFIFDTFIPDLKQLIDGLNNVVDFEGEYEPGKKVQRIVTTKPSLINQIIDIEFKFRWEEDNQTKEKVWQLPLRFFFRYEIEHLIEKSQFTDYQIFGDYFGNSLCNTSKEFVVLCTKK